MLLADPTVLFLDAVMELQTAISNSVMMVTATTVMDVPTLATGNVVMESETPLVSSVMMEQ